MINLRQAWVTSAILLAAMAVMTGVAWPMLPPGQPIPIHFTFDGTPNRFAPPEYGLLILPAFVLLIGVTMTLRAARNDFSGFVPLADRPLSLAWLIVLAVFASGQALIIGYAIHPGAEVLRLFFGAIGLLIAVAGAMLSRVEPNAAIGIRTPWTRADRGVWEATHRFGSIVFVSAGVALAGVAAFWSPPPSLVLLTLADLGAAAVLCTLYSYLIYRSRLPNQDPALRAGVTPWKE